MIAPIRHACWPCGCRYVAGERHECAKVDRAAVMATRVPELPAGAVSVAGTPDLERRGVVGVDGHAEAPARATDSNQTPVHAAPLPAPNKYGAVPTVRDGIRFGSKGEAALYDHLRARCVWVLPHPRFPLLALLEPGQRVPMFTPDFLAATAYPLAGEIGHRVEAVEFKGGRAAESRDYTLRAAAFRKSYPSIPLRVFRKVRGDLKEDSA